MSKAHKFEYKIVADERSENLQKMISERGDIPMADILGRIIVCTASRAHYGGCSHWIISIQGTPPRGTIIFDTNRYIAAKKAILLVRGKCVSLGGKSYRIVEEWIQTFLRDKER